MGERDHNKDFYDLLEKVITVDQIANKWLMWGEIYLPEQTTYVPSIFQLRDAQSHFIKMFANGINKQYLAPDASEYEAFILDSETYHQLREIFSHTTRAFYDAADYLIMSITDGSEDNELTRSSEDIERAKRKKDNELTHSNKGNKQNVMNAILYTYGDELNDIRASKSESIENNYQVILRYDSLLQKVTSVYLLSDVSDLRYGYKSIIDLMTRIEDKYEMEYIKEHKSDFYELKQEIIIESDKYNPYDIFKELNGTLSDVTSWQEEQKNEAMRQGERLNSIYSDLKYLEIALNKSPYDAKRHGGLRAFCMMIKPWVYVLTIFASSFIGMLVSYGVSNSIALPAIAVPGSKNVFNNTFVLNVAITLSISFLILLILFFVSYGIYKWFNKRK